MQPLAINGQLSVKNEKWQNPTYCFDFIYIVYFIIYFFRAREHSRWFPANVPLAQAVSGPLKI
jgi:hypothetical protein